MLLEGTKKAKTIAPSAFNIDIALELINSHLKESIEVRKASIQGLNKFKADVNDKLKTLEKHIVDHHSYLVDQIRFKSIDPMAQLNKAFSCMQKVDDPKNYKNSVRRVSELFSVKKQEKALSE